LGGRQNNSSNVSPALTTTPLMRLLPLILLLLLVAIVEELLLLVLLLLLLLLTDRIRFRNPSNALPFEKLGAMLPLLLVFFASTDDAAITAVLRTFSFSCSGSLLLVLILLLFLSGKQLDGMLAEGYIILL
jgi:hypothetical protein